MTRNYTAYISAKTHWLLTRLVKASNTKCSERDVPQTIDSILEGIVTEHVEETCPKLLELFEKREAINAEAEKLI